AGQGPGSVWLYDISDVGLPVAVGRIPPPRRGAQPVASPDITSWCAAHGIAWHPRIENLIAVTWYSAGIGVFDVTLPLMPVEVGFFRAEDSLAEAVVWHGGLLYSNDLRRGVDVLALDR
ncbi:MAG: hypothetical protein M3124_09660, partial [Actinomycetota bacterium]|nr:hypothetical protein [Actinomycetota bacterium]